jgi:hypothetical protein
MHGHLSRFRLKCFFLKKRVLFAEFLKIQKVVFKHVWYLYIVVICYVLHSMYNKSMFI